MDKPKQMRGVACMTLEARTAITRKDGGNVPAEERSFATDRTLGAEALRRHDVKRTYAADDGDFLKTFAVWADADTAAQAENAKAAYRRADLSPRIAVVTGRTPETRAQFWWPVEAAIDDIELLRAT